MPLQRKRLQCLTLHRPLKPVIGENDRMPRFEAEGTAFTGTLQPMDGFADRQLYGEQVTRLQRLLTTDVPALEQGMGICTADGSWYRIRQPVSCWKGHCVAVLEALV